MNNKTKSITIGVVVVVFFLALIKLVSISGLFQSSPSVRFPERSESPTVVLKDSSFKEKVRLVQYAADKRTRVSMRIDLMDGGTAAVEFSKGRASRLVQFYPPPTPVAGAAPVADPLNDPLDKRQVMRVTEFKADGTSVATQHTYLPNGALKEVAVRTPEDNLLVTVFRDDMSGVERIQTFDKTTGLLKSERAFNPDGSLASLLGEKLVSYSTQVQQDFYSANGKVTRSVIFSSYDVTVNELADDGITVKQATVYGYGDVTVTTFNTTTNKKLISRSFAKDGSIGVTFFDAAGVQNLAQKWVKLDTTDSAITPDRIDLVNDGYVLQSITEYMPDGSSSKRVITFYPGGKIVQNVELRPNGNWSPRTVKVFREDGSLDRVEEYTWSQMTKSTSMPAGPNKIRENISSDLTRMTTLLPGPNPDKSDMPRLTKRQLQYNFD